MASPFVYAVVTVLVHSSLCGVLAKGDWCLSNFMSGDNSKSCSDKVGQSNGQQECNQSACNMGGHWNSMCCGGCPMGNFGSPMDHWGYNGGCCWPMCNGFGPMGPYGSMGPYGGMFGCGGMCPGFGNMCHGFGGMCHSQGKMHNQGNMSHGRNCNMCPGQGNMCHGFGPMFHGCSMNPFASCMYNNMCWNNPMWYNNGGCMGGPWGNSMMNNNPFWGGGCMNNCNMMNSSGSNFGNNNTPQGHCEQNKPNQASTFNNCMSNCKPMENNQGSHMKCNHNTFTPSNSGYTGCKGNSNFMPRSTFCQ